MDHEPAAAAAADCAAVEHVVVAAAAEVGDEHQGHVLEATAGPGLKRNVNDQLPWKHFNLCHGSSTVLEHAYVKSHS